MGIFSPTSPQSPRFGPLANVPLTISGIDPGDTSRMTGMSPMPTLGMTRGGAGVMRAPMAVDGVDPNAAGTLADPPPAIDPQALPKATRAGILDDPTTRHALLRAGLATLATRNIGEGGLAAANYVDQQKAITAKAAVTAEDLRLKNAAELREGTKTDADVAYKQALVPALIDQHTAMADQARARGGYYTAQGDVLPMKVQGQIDYDKGRLDNQRYNTDQRVGAMERGQDMRGPPSAATAVPGPLGPPPSKPLKLTDVNRLAGMVMPGIIGSMPALHGGVQIGPDKKPVDDAKAAAAALRANPALNGEVMDAIRSSDGSAGGATRAVQGVMSHYGYHAYQGEDFKNQYQPTFFAKPQVSPQAVMPPAGAKQPAPAASPVKVLNGHAYQKINGIWNDMGPASGPAA